MASKSIPSPCYDHLVTRQEKLQPYLITSNTMQLHLCALRHLFLGQEVTDAELFWRLSQWKYKSVSNLIWK